MSLASATELVLEHNLYSWTELAPGRLGININKLASSDDTDQKGRMVIFIHGADLRIIFFVFEKFEILCRRTLQLASLGQTSVIYSEPNKKMIWVNANSQMTTGQTTPKWDCAKNKNINFRSFILLLFGFWVYTFLNNSSLTINLSHL